MKEIVSVPKIGQFKIRVKNLNLDCKMNLIKNDYALNKTVSD